MSSQTIAMEGAVADEICTATELLLVDNLIFAPFGVLIVGEERRCISLLRFKIPIIIVVFRWWRLAFSCVSHHGNDIFCDGGDGTLELAIAGT